MLAGQAVYRLDAGRAPGASMAVVGHGGPRVQERRWFESDIIEASM